MHVCLCVCIRHDPHIRLPQQQHINSSASSEVHLMLESTLKLGRTGTRREPPIKILCEQGLSQPQFLLPHVCCECFLSVAG